MLDPDTPHGPGTSTARATEVDQVNTGPSFACTEFDNAEVSQYERTGYVLANGYRMNRDCDGPYKDISVVDAREPTRLKVATKFPRPQPPADAPFKDGGQRGADFRPKHPSAIGQPGRWRQGAVP